MSDTLFHEFFDDAAIFPPGLAPLDAAVRDHIRRSQNNVTDEFIGPLILPVDKVDEAVSLAEDHEIQFSVISQADALDEVTALIGRLARDHEHATIVALEAKVGNDVAADIASVATFADDNPDVDVFVELPYPAITDEHLAVLAQGGVSLKFRTGGITQALFPTPEQLVDVINRAHQHGVRFKLTAGLHRAMRYVNPETGFQHFGFLNIAAATAALRSGSDVAEAARLLNSDDATTITSVVTETPEWRESFSSFGTCSVAEPAETLTELGLLEDQIARQFQ